MNLIIFFLLGQNINNLKNNNNELICIEKSLKINKGNHVNNETIDCNKISDIYINFYKKSLLNDLMNENIDITKKIEKINYYNDNFNYKIYQSNISAGGLFDDWDF
jgi:hypothetical protein